MTLYEWAHYCTHTSCNNQPLFHDTDRLSLHITMGAGFTISVMRDLFEVTGHKTLVTISALQWHYDEHGGVSNHQPHHRLLNRLFRRKSRKTSKLRVTGFCAGNSPVASGFTAQRPVTRKIFPPDDVVIALLPLCAIKPWFCNKEC